MSGVSHPLVASRAALGGNCQQALPVPAVSLRVQRSSLHSPKLKLAPVKVLLTSGNGLLTFMPICPGL